MDWNRLRAVFKYILHDNRQEQHASNS